MKDNGKFGVIFTAVAGIIILALGAQAEPPDALDDLYITASNTPVACYTLLNDSDPNPGHVLSISSFDAVSTQGGTVSHNGNGVFQYTPAAGFAGLDTFSYTATDGFGGYDTAAVRIDVNVSFDPEAARTQILNGVSVLGDPSGAGGCVAYGPTAYSIANYGGEDRRDPAVAAATLGQGRVIAMPDHQWLRMNSLAGSGNTAQFYLNSIVWLTGTTSKNIKIVCTNVDNNDADVWLTAQGFTNVVKTTNYAAELADADILIGWLGSGISQGNVDVITNFARNGGALFLADYGIGYVWWWTGTGVVNAPGNRVLRHAGIGFAKEGGGSLTIGRSSGQTTADEVIAMLANSSGYSSTALDIGGTVLGRMYQVLPEGDSLLARLDQGFWGRINNINPTPATPVSNSFERALLQREASILAGTAVDDITAHRTAEGVYGTIPPATPRITRTISYNVSKAGKDARSGNSVIWLSTGLYAAPGEIVNVTVGSAFTGLGLKVKINGDWNDVSERSSYLRMPFGTSREFDINQPTVKAANAFGGLLYIIVPQNVVPGTFGVTFQNVIEAPYFVRGRDTNADWINSIRNKPAPWAEMACDNVIITISSGDVRDLDKAEELMTFWNDGVAAQDDLAGLVGRRTRPDRMYNMIQTAWGSGYAGYPIGAWDWNFGDYQEMERGNCWGEFHELGHLHQSGYWTDGRTGEVTVNIFSMRGIEAVCDSGKADGGWGNQWAPAERVLMYQSAAGKGGFDEADLSERLCMYSQLKTVFGWPAFKATFNTYQVDEQTAPQNLPTNDQQEWDQFMVRFSRQVGYDLSPFFVSWDYGVSQAAISSLGDLAGWNMLEIIEDVYQTTENSSVLISNPAGNDFSFDGVRTLVSVGNPSRGTLQNNGNGTYTYYPNPGFRGYDFISYIVRNGFGDTFSGTIKITVTRGDKLIAYYTFDNDDIDGNTVFDMSGPVESDASIKEATKGATGRIEQALSFDGVNDYAEIPALNLNSKAVTIAGWIKRGGSQSDYAGIIFSRSGSTIAGLNFRGTTNQLGYHWNGASNTYSFNSGLLVPDNTWTFIALVVNSSKATLYMNTQTAVNNVSHNIEEFNGVTGIGRDQTGRYFRGSIDEVSIWNRALSSTEIQSLYNSGRTLANGLPVFDSDPFSGKDAAEGMAYNADISSAAQDPEGDGLVFSKVSGPGWLVVAAGGDISGTPASADVGQNDFIIQAEDALGGVRQATLSITVGDIHKGDKGLTDFEAFAAQWMRTGCSDFPACSGCSLDGDSDVDIDDLVVFSLNWLQ